MYTVKLTEYAKSDYEKLDGSQKQSILVDGRMGKSCRSSPSAGVTNYKSIKMQ